jgi:hypothetical protein
MTSTSSTTFASDINSLLNDKLFQVIGSTPKSVAESIMKSDIRGKAKLGVEMFAIACFAAAVNKPTLESFMADPRFGTIRPLITATISINGKANMTAMTLLGHALLTTPEAGAVNFTAEFRKKMGQNHLWDGELNSGSLSDKQKEILKEKKRLTDGNAAKALGSGFLKLTGINSDPMNKEESDLYNLAMPASTASTAGGASAFSTSGNESNSAAEPTIGASQIKVDRSSSVLVPDDVLAYRRNILQHDEARIASSINRKGVDTFIEETRGLMTDDPDGARARRAGTTMSPGNSSGKR